MLNFNDRGAGVAGGLYGERRETFPPGLQGWSIVFLAIFVKNRVRTFIKRHLRTLDIIAR